MVNFIVIPSNGLPTHIRDLLLQTEIALYFKKDPSSFSEKGAAHLS